VIASDLHDVSLDHTQVSLEASDPAVHDKMVGADGACRETVNGIEAALAAGLYVTTNTTLTKENSAVFPDLLRFGKQLGLKTMGCNSLICSGKGPTKIKQDGLSIEELKWFCPWLWRLPGTGDRTGLVFSDLLQRSQSP